jgi:hypothetical protein
MKLALRAVLSFAILVAALSFARRADAYPWMIRQQVTDCQTCHADPSGGSLLNSYGRLMGERAMRTHYGAGDKHDALGGFLFGAVPLPDSVLLGGDVRYFRYSVKAGDAPVQSNHFFMQADLTGQVTVGRFRANASIGYAEQGAAPAAITTAAEHNLVSRVHWVGADLGEKNEFLLRAGRMNLPFGVRNIEHTMWVRSATGTDINSSQQHGVALAWGSGMWRAEAMGILGNYQVSPDAFRQRGYAAYLEMAPLPALAAGVSSMVTHTNTDIALGSEAIRQAHGIFARWSPWKPLVLMGESDVTHSSQPVRGSIGATNLLGVVNMLQADFEAIQGVHVMATGELWSRPNDTKFASIGAWGSLVWFFAPHADVRLDGIYQSLPSPGPRLHVTSVVLQGHVYL